MGEIPWPAPASKGWPSWSDRRRARPLRRARMRKRGQAHGHAHSRRESVPGQVVQQSFGKPIHLLEVLGIDALACEAFLGTQHPAFLHSVRHRVRNKARGGVDARGGACLGLHDVDEPVCPLELRMPLQVCLDDARLPVVQLPGRLRRQLLLQPRDRGGHQLVVRENDLRGERFDRVDHRGSSFFFCPVQSTKGPHPATSTAMGQKEAAGVE
mmetsp:Transcript_30014/g.82345  ORF Transcript_30014/g.82345 Transcript_30014/m.82345 type:complete len:212 (-) Transcript_30014:730-1365(-)